MRIKQRLSLQQQASQGKQPVRDAAQGTAVRAAALAKRSIPGPTFRIVLAGDTRPVIDRIAQSDVRSVAHDDTARLAIALGDTIALPPLPLHLRALSRRLPILVLALDGRNFLLGIRRG
jgi:hypothetical protein